MKDETGQQPKHKTTHTVLVEKEDEENMNPTAELLIMYRDVRFSKFELKENDSLKIIEMDLLEIFQTGSSKFVVKKIVLKTRLPDATPVTGSMRGATLIINIKKGKCNSQHVNRDKR